MQEDPVEGATSLGELFERYEALPARGAEEETRREIVDRILAAVSTHLAADGPGAESQRPVRDATARVRMLSPGAQGFDAAVRGLIRAARATLGPERIAGVLPARHRGPAPVDGPDGIDEASEESFPASDPPAFRPGDDGPP